ncbi:MAG: lipopolysaccharide biosynthesis protein [Chloroflexi bacterium]|nr:lipopolysaccharide biosynthesis protein [Chloroflexota bacterium]
MASPFYKNAYYMLANSGVAALTGFFFWLVSARFYTARDVGLASATLSSVVFLASIADMGLSISLIRFLPSATNRLSLINTSFTVGVLASFLAGAIFLTGLNLWSPALLLVRENPLLASLFLLLLPLSAVSVMGDRVFIALRIAKYGFIRHLLIILEIPLAVALVSWLHVAGILMAAGIAVGLSVAFSLFVLLPRIQRGYFPWPGLQREYLKQTFGYSMGNHVSFLLLGAPGWIFPLLVVNLLGPEQNAYFYISWTIGVTLAAIPSAISYSFFAEGSHDENGLLHFATSALKLSLLLVVPAIAVIFVVSNRLLLLFGRAYSEEGLLLLRVLALSTLPGTFNTVYLTYRRVTKEVGLVLGISGAIALLSLVAGYLLVPRLGVLGAGLGYLGAQTVVALWLGANLYVRNLSARGHKTEKVEENVRR